MKSLLTSLLIGNVCLVSACSTHQSQATLQSADSSQHSLLVCTADATNTTTSFVISSDKNPSDGFITDADGVWQVAGKISAFISLTKFTCGDDLMQTQIVGAPVHLWACQQNPVLPTDQASDLARVDVTSQNGKITAVQTSPNGTTSTASCVTGLNPNPMMGVSN